MIEQLDCQHRFQYIDFLHYAWTAQMINQFQNTNIYIFLGIEVGSQPSSRLQLPCTFHRRFKLALISWCTAQQSNHSTRFPQSSLLATQCSFS